MKGNTLEEFLKDVKEMGGPEKEFIYKDKTYFLEATYNNDTSKDELLIFECFGEQKTIFLGIGDSLEDVYNQFIEAKIFDGRTILEAHEDIEVTFG